MRRLDLTPDERDELDERAYREHVQREVDKRSMRRPADELPDNDVLYGESPDY